jgi:hypothetical protein
VAENLAKGYAKGMVLGYRKLKSEIDYRDKYFTQEFWDSM